MDAFFRKFFPEDNDVMQAFHTEVDQQLPEQGALLDLGCGDLRAVAPYRRGGRTVWGSDFETHPRLTEPQWFRPLRADGGIPFADAQFDVVTGIWVLEHIAKPAAFCQEVSRVLRPGGRFIGLSIDGRHYVSWLTRLFRALPHEVTQQIVYRLYGRLPHDTHPTHYRLNTPWQLQRAARSAGLRVAEVRHFANPDYFSFCRPLRKAAIVADWLLTHLSTGLGKIYFVTTLEKPTLAGRRRSAA